MIEGSDADSFAYSLSNFAEVLWPCLEAVDAKSVTEVGAFRGATTRELLDWAEPRGCTVSAIDPVPPQELLALERERPELDLVREPSLEALERVELADVVILDGDHNYYTLSNELRLIGERAPGAELPLLLMHDAGWPLARRDAYEAPERIPDEHRQPMALDAGIVPGEPGTVSGRGLFYSHVAAREGGPRNGVLTAIEDFVAGRDGLRLALVPAFFGLAVVWHEGATWADRVEAVLAPWDRNPMLERLERNRLLHLIARLDLDAQLDREHAAQGKPEYALARGIARMRARLSPRRGRGPA